MSQSPRRNLRPGTSNSSLAYIPKKRDWFLLALGLLLAAGIIGIASWSIEYAWIKPSVALPPEGAVGKTQWGGFMPEMRTPPRVFLDNDPYYWISYARQMARSHEMRIRYTDLDNVPFGREVHWNSGYMLWLLLNGAAVRMLTGQDMWKAIETGALAANPVLFLFVLAGSGWLIVRRFGGALAMGFVVLLPCLTAVSWDFGYARPDHHGMHDLAALGLLLGIALYGSGWVRRRDSTDPADAWPARREAQRGFLLSGIFGAVGLWVGATQQIFILAGAGLGLMGAIWMASRSGKDRVPIALEPRLMRYWGVSGFSGSLLFYCWEYFPSHLGMRLEVNHPLYAFAWLGASEVLYQFARWRVSGQSPKSWSMLYLFVGFVLAAAPIFAILMGPSEWHALHDSIMRRQHLFIVEFEPLSHFLKSRPALAILNRFGLLPLAIPAAMGLMFYSRLGKHWKSTIFFVLSPTLLTGIMTFLQIRWAGLFSICLATLALVVCGAVFSSVKPQEGPRRIFFSIALPLLFVFPSMLSFFIGVNSTVAQARSGVVYPILAWTIASRDVALNLKRLSATGPVRVMSGPGQTPALHYFGGVHGTGALYWENLDGVSDAAAFFSDPGDQRALEIVKARGITHVVVEQSPVLAEQSCEIFYGKKDAAAVEASLAYRLANPLGEIPSWLEPVPYYGSPMAANFQMRIYRVVPTRAP